MSDFDDVGDVGDLSWADDVGSLSIGALRRGMGKRRSSSSRNRVNAGRLIPRVPGAPAVGLRLQPLGFTPCIFALNSGTLLSTTSRPQRPFKGKRLVVDIARVGVTAVGLISVTQILIGSNNQLVNSSPIGAGTFAPGAYDTNLELAAASTAIDITLQFANSTIVTGTDQCIVQPTILGEAIG